MAVAKRRAATVAASIPGPQPCLKKLYLYIDKNEIYGMCKWPVDVIMVNIGHLWKVKHRGRQKPGKYLLF